MRSARCWLDLSWSLLELAKHAGPESQGELFILSLEEKAFREEMRKHLKAPLKNPEERPAETLASVRLQLDLRGIFFQGAALLNPRPAEKKKYLEFAGQSKIRSEKLRKLSLKISPREWQGRVYLRFLWESWIHLGSGLGSLVTLVLLIPMYYVGGLFVGRGRS